MCYLFLVSRDTYLPFTNKSPVRVIWIIKEKLNHIPRSELFYLVRLKISTITVNKRLREKPLKSKYYDTAGFILD